MSILLRVYRAAINSKNLYDYFWNRDGEDKNLGKELNHRDTKSTEYRERKEKDPRKDCGKISSNINTQWSNERRVHFYELLNNSIQLFVEIFIFPVVPYFDYPCTFKGRSV